MPTDVYVVHEWPGAVPLFAVSIHEPEEETSLACLGEMIDTFMHAEVGHPVDPDSARWTPWAEVLRRVGISTCSIEKKR